MTAHRNFTDANKSTQRHTHTICTTRNKYLAIKTDLPRLMDASFSHLKLHTHTYTLLSHTICTTRRHIARAEKPQTSGCKISHLKLRIHSRFSDIQYNLHHNEEWIRLSPLRRTRLTDGCTTKSSEFTSRRKCEHTSNTSQTSHTHTLLMHTICTTRNKYLAIKADLPRLMDASFSHLKLLTHIHVSQTYNLHHNEERIRFSP